MKLHQLHMRNLYLDEEIKNLKKKRFKLFGKGFSIGFGAGVVSSAVARNR